MLLKDVAKTVNDVNWYNKGSALCIDYVKMHVKDPQLYASSVEHRFLVSGICLPLNMYRLHVLNRDVNVIKLIKHNILL